MTIRRALILSLGDFLERDLVPEHRNALTIKLQGWYRSDPDAGVHAAAEWLLRTWKQGIWLRKVNDEWAADRGQREKKWNGIATASGLDAHWYVNGQGQTMVVISGPVEFLMGSPETEAGRLVREIQHTRRIPRSFAIANKPATLEEYGRFDKSQEGKLAEQFRRAPDLPVVNVEWHRAARYCNWLSQKEGIDKSQWCYEITSNSVRVKPNYLSLTGYRLPTEAEMEYVIRAGALTSRYFGESEDLLARYAWCIKNSQEQTWPVGLLRPNDLGLFDALGNVWTWCQETYQDYPNGKGVYNDTEKLLSMNGLNNSLRGGSYFQPASAARAASRMKLIPSSAATYVGFRVARTYR